MSDEEPERDGAADEGEEGEEDDWLVPDDPMDDERTVRSRPDLAQISPRSPDDPMDDERSVVDLAQISRTSWSAR